MLTVVKAASSSCLCDSAKSSDLLHLSVLPSEVTLGIITGDVLRTVMGNCSVRSSRVSHAFYRVFAHGLQVRGALLLLTTLFHSLYLATVFLSIYKQPLPPALPTTRLFTGP